MVAVQKINHGGRVAYIGALSLSDLSMEISSPLPPELEPLLKWLKEEEKAVGEIAKFVKSRIANGEHYVTGPIVIGLFSQGPEQEPSFDPFPWQEGESDDAPKYGSLRLRGNERWVVIDGKQRVSGMIKALHTMTRHKEKLALNHIPIVFLPVSSIEQLEDLIVRMHKSAREVTRGETIRTAIDDEYSIYANWLMGNDVPKHPGAIPKGLVNWKSNTITNRLPKFTTLSTLYDSAKILDLALGRLSSSSTPEQIDERYLQIYRIWKLLLDSFSPFQRALEEGANLPLLREQLLCVRPTGQLILMNVMALALKASVSLIHVVERLQDVRWEMTNPIWKDVIIVEGRVNGRASATLLAAKLVAYLIGIPASERDKKALARDYKKGEEALPSPIFTEAIEYVDSQEAI